MPDSQTSLIIGAGQSGGDCATALRQQGYTGRIILIGDEPHPPYRRPPLSKAYLAGDATGDSLYLKPQAAYARAGIDCLLGVRALGIDRTRRHVEISDGQSLPYDKLVLATGGRPRPLSIAGAERAKNLHYLRTIADVDRIHKDFIAGRRLVIVGGGYIGLEVAAAALKRGMHVTILESAPRVLIRVTSPEMSAFYEDVHRKAGVDIRTDAIIEDLVLQGGNITGIRLAGDEVIATDSVIVGIGLVPNVELAAAAGLVVEDGIVVDEQAATSDPDIFAIGDCSNQPNAFYGGRVRLESVPNATEQAQKVAAALTGKPLPQAALPWFWSDQYNLKLQMAGLSRGFDQTVRRGEIHAGGFVMFYLRDDVLIAADAVNRPKDFMLAKQLIARKVRPEPRRLADPATPLLELLESGPSR